MATESKTLGMGARLRALAIWCLVLAGAVLAGCAQDVGLIDRVQPGALHKSIFEGEWYFARTVVDAPYHVGYTFIGETEELERVRFEIRQDQLVAYRTYDFIAGTDIAHSGSAHPGSKVNGTPIAAWPIVRHFDVIRSYNATTGEQTNVLEENETDRPWNERGYIRVNWSNNLMSSFAFTVDGVDAEPATAAILTPDDPDAFTLAWRGKDGSWVDSRDPSTHRERKSAEYIDFVVKVATKPIAYDFWDADWGPERYPACWFFLNEDCRPAEISVRNALYKVDAKRDADYLPLAYPDNAIARDDAGDPIRVFEWADIVPDGKEEATVSLGLAQDPDGFLVRLPWFDKFGYFRTERYGYDDKHGEVESARQQQIQRHAIWKRYRDDSGAPLPYSAREIEPIVYYLSPGFPAVLREAAQRTADGWDLAFRKAVAARKGVALDAVPPIFVLRDNTLKVDADGTVVDRGQRVGDLRYSLLSNVDEPTRAGLLGYGPAWADPVNGRIINAAAHMYGAQLRRFATTGRDLVRLVQGEIDPQSYGLGETASDEVVASLLGKAGDPTALASGKAGMPGPKGKGAQSSNKPAPSGKGGGSAAGGGAKAWLPALPDAEARREAASAFAAARVDPKQKKAIANLRKEKLVAHGNWAQARLDHLEDEAIEAAFLTRDAALGWGTPAAQAQIANAPAGAPLPALDAETRARISPRRWAGLSNRLAALDRERLLRKHNMMHAAFVDDGVLGIAKQLKDLDPDEAWTQIYIAVFHSTALHEVGHTLGLRHNFEASTDAMNWHKGYWALRGADGKPLETPTQAQLDAGMNDFRYSSIMEYAGRFHADLKGLGRYDEAAIAFGYAEMVEVWGDKAVAALQNHGMVRALGEELRYLGNGDPSRADPARVVDAATRGFVHYTGIPKMVGGVEQLDDRRLVPMEDIVAEMTAVGGTETSPRKRTLWPVPYRFCSDEYEGGTKTCHVYDDGADPWEIVESGMQRWRDHYFIDAFRRDRVDFFLDDYAGRAWFRYMHPVVLQYQHWLFDLYDPDDPYNPGFMWDWMSYYRPARAGISETSWEKADQGGLAASEAVRRGIGWLASVLSNPEPGSYCLDKAKNEYRWLSFNTSGTVCATPQTCDGDGSCADLIIPVGVGRYQWTEFDKDTGYTFYERLKFAGAFYDKVTALEVLADPTTYFIGVDASQPLNNYILSTFLYFSKEITSIFGGLAAGRSDVVGWKVKADGSLLQPDPFAAPAAGQALPSIEMPGLYTLRPYAMLYGMAWLNAAWDSTFNDSIKIWLDGSGEAMALPGEATVATFTSPLNYRVYQALKLPREGWFSAGYEMVAGAAKIAEAYKANPTDVGLRYDLEDATTFIDLVRGMYDIFGLTVF